MESAATVKRQRRLFNSATSKFYQLRPVCALRSGSDLIGLHADAFSSRGRGLYFSFDRRWTIHNKKCKIHSKGQTNTAYFCSQHNTLLRGTRFSALGFPDNHHYPGAGFLGL